MLPTCITRCLHLQAWQLALPGQNLHLSMAASPSSAWQAGHGLMQDITQTHSHEPGTAQHGHAPCEQAMASAMCGRWRSLEPATQSWCRTSPKTWPRTPPGLRSRWLWWLLWL